MQLGADTTDHRITIRPRQKKHQGRSRLQLPHQIAAVPRAPRHPASWNAIGLAVFRLIVAVGTRQPVRPELTPEAPLLFQISCFIENRHEQSRLGLQISRLIKLNRFAVKMGSPCGSHVKRCCCPSKRQVASTGENFTSTAVYTTHLNDYPVAASRPRFGSTSRNPGTSPC